MMIEISLPVVLFAAVLLICFALLVWYVARWNGYCTGWHDRDAEDDMLVTHESAWQAGHEIGYQKALKEIDALHP